MHVEHALAEVLDRVGEYAGAMAHAGAHHALQLAGLPASQHYRPDAISAFVDRLIKAFPVEDPPAYPPDGAELPVYIVGMPRSGTSLIEQILAEHPAVYGGGERGEVERMVDAAMRVVAPDMDYPEGFAVLRPERLAAIARDYLCEIAAIAGDAVRFTDKLPQNFLFLGALSRLLPGVRVIHCRRSALDTCVSIYLREFGAAHAYGYRLDWLAHYYLEYERLMAHWSRLPGLRMIEVRYEDVVGDIEGQARRMTEFLDLPWTPAVLDFHRSGRRVNTASYDQVRRPIYTSSIGRWRRYGDAVAPLIAVLGER